MNPKGFQDSLTDPKDAKIMILLFLIIFLLSIFIISFAWYHLFLVILLYLIMYGVSKSNLPPINDLTYLIKIYDSMNLRYLEYIKKEDSEKAAACSAIKKMLETKYPDL